MTEIDWKSVFDLKKYDNPYDVHCDEFWKIDNGVLALYSI